MVKKKSQLTEEQKHLKVMNKCQPVYEAIKEELNLDGDEINQVHQLVEAACYVKGLIEDERTNIENEGLGKAQKLLTIDKSTWMEFVKMTAKKMYGNFSQTAYDKLGEKIAEKFYINNLQQAFYDSYLADETLKKVDESEESTAKFTSEEDTEFAKVIEEYAKIMDYIRQTLYKRLDNLAKAAFFITDGKLSKKDFKDLAEWEYNAMSSSEMPKAWSIYNKFARMYRIMDSYGFEQIVDMDHEFGLNIEVGTPHPESHEWDNDEEDDE